MKNTSFEEDYKYIKNLYKEIAEIQKQTEIQAAKRIAELDAEFKRRDEEAAKRIAEHAAKLDAESKRRDEEAAKRIAEHAAKLDAEFKRRDEEAAKRKAEFDEEFKRRDEESTKQMSKFNAEITRINETMGYYSNSIGVIAEEYFFNSFNAGRRNFFGEKFNDIDKNVKGIKQDYKDEYDILLINGKTIGIIEVKSKANLSDFPKILRKAKTFRVNFPEYKNHKVYLGLASLAFRPRIEIECQKKGIAIIKQVGDNLIIIDENIKSY